MKKSWKESNSEKNDKMTNRDNHQSNEETKNNNFIKDML